MKRPPCKHCRERPGYQARGLCWRCYRDLTVRRLYPQDPRAKRPEHEPTEEELEALIAEQSKPENLPGWWPEESRRVRRAADPRRADP